MQGAESTWAALVSSLPQHHPDNPLLWSEEDRQRLLRGTSIQQEASSRAQVECRSASGSCTTAGVMQHSEADLWTRQICASNLGGTQPDCSSSVIPEHMTEAEGEKVAWAFTDLRQGMCAQALEEQWQDLSGALNSAGFSSGVAAGVCRLFPGCAAWGITAVSRPAGAALVFQTLHSQPECHLQRQPALRACLARRALQQAALL